MNDEFNHNFTDEKIENTAISGGMNVTITRDVGAWNA